MNKNALIAGVALLALLAGSGSAWWYQTRSTAQLSKSAENDGQKLWQASFRNLSGTPQPMAAYRGKPLVLNFWATWCGPCREEMPEFEAASVATAGRVQFVGIAIDNPAAVSKFLQETGVSYPILLAEQDGLDLMRQLGNPVGALPYTAIYDASGRRIAAHAGRLSRTSLDAYLTTLLAGKPK